jgi:hypothetical protein
MPETPILIFDTSALNRFAKDSDSKPLFAGVLSAYAVRITGMTLDEFAATPELDVRRSLFHVCRRLLATGRSIAIEPPAEILKLLIQQHSVNPNIFDWTNVTTRSIRLEEAIYDDILIEDDELAKEQRTGILSTQKALEKLYERQRGEIEDSLRLGLERRPTNFEAHLAMIQAPGGAFWRFVGEYYETDAVAAASEANLRDFFESCPPFRAFFLALALKWYDKCVRPLQMISTFRVKRNDLMFSVYLPYCDEFITADAGQESALKRVAYAANLRVRVRSYEDFASSFVVGVLGA